MSNSQPPNTAIRRSTRARRAPDTRFCAASASLRASSRPLRARAPPGNAYPRLMRSDDRPRLARRLPSSPTTHSLFADTFSSAGIDVRSRGSDLLSEVARDS